MKKILLIFIFLWIIQFSAWAQKIDSLKKVLFIKKLPDTSRVLTLNELAIEFRNIQPDTCYKLANQALKISQSIQYSKGEGISYRILGIYFLVKNDYQQALFYYKKALPFIEKTKNLKDIAWTNVNIGTVYRNQGNQQIALDYYFKALQNFEKVKDFKGVGWVYNNIGEIYKTQFNYDKALEYHLKSLEMREKVGDQQDISLSYFNIGVINQLQKKLPSALEFLLKSLQIREKIKDNRGKIQVYINIGKIYIWQNSPEKAFQYLNLAKDLTKMTQTKDKSPELNTTLAMYYNKNKQPDLAFNYAQTALIEARIIGNVEFIQLAAEQYQLAAQKLGKYQEAYEGLSLFKQMSDSILNLQNQKLAIQREYQYRENQQKLEQEKKNLAYQAELERERWVLYTALLGLFLGLTLAFLAYRSYRIKQRANILLAEQQKSILAQNELLQSQKDEINTQNEELQQTQEEILAQREVIEQRNLVLAEQNTQIQNSIKAAKMIQTAILPFENLMNSLLNDYFLIFRPRDVVSGDFYWLSTYNNKTLVAVADCTGHGVPGAFMSMIGHTSLDRIVEIKHISEPAKILQSLHEEILHLLKQEESNNNYGMDTCVVSIEKLTNGQFELNFAGAKRHCYYINALNINELHKISGTRKSIGGVYQTQNEFEETKVILPSNSMIYLCTDGYEDQNNDKRKRFGEENLMHIIRANAALPLTEQQQILEQKLDEFQINTTQRDDILVLGIKL